MDDEKLRILDEYSSERRTVLDKLAECANQLATARAEADQLKERRKALAEQIRGLTDKERRLSQKLKRASDARDKRLAQVDKAKKKKEEKRKAHEEEEDLDYEEEEEEEAKEPPMIPVSHGVDPLLEGIRLESKRADQLIVFAMDHMTPVPREKLLLWRPPGWEDGISAVQDLDSFLTEVKYDQFRRVRDRAKTVFSGSWAEEEAAKADPSNNSRFKLRAYRALDVALRSPDCSFRTLGLLVGWANATDAGSVCYQLEEMLGAWVAGFEGLEWPNEGLPLAFLPQQRNKGRRVVQVPISRSSNITIPRLDPPMTGVHGWPFTNLPLRWRSDMHEYITAMPKLEDELLDLDAVYVAPDLNAQRLVNQASKFLNLLYSLPLATILESFVYGRTRPYRLEESRKHVSKRYWDASPETWSLVDRVVKTVLELE